MAELRSGLIDSHQNALRQDALKGNKKTCCYRTKLGHHGKITAIWAIVVSRHATRSHTYRDTERDKNTKIKFRQ